MHYDEKAYHMKEIRKHPRTPYMLANEKLAKDLFEEVKKAWPDAVMVAVGRQQAILVTPQSVKRYKKILQEREQGLWDQLKEVRDAQGFLESKMER